MIVFSYAPQGSVTTAALAELYRTLSRMGREANQGEIGVVMDGVTTASRSTPRSNAMLISEEIQRVLHAGRVVPLAVPNPHGPLGLEQLAAAVAAVSSSGGSAPGVRRALHPRPETWDRLDQLADAQTRAANRTVSASDVAAAIIEQFVDAGSRS